MGQLRHRAIVFFVAVSAAWTFPQRSLWAEEPALGRTGDGFPGAARLSAPGPLEPSVVLGGSLGYGLTEAVFAQDGTHHRLGGGLSVAWVATDWLALSLRFDGRYDADVLASGTDDSFTLEPRLGLLVARGLGLGWRGGLRLGLWWPTRSGSSLDPAALTPEGQLLVSWSASTIPLSLMAGAGFRLDRSAAAIDTPEELSAADRIALGLSAFDAVPLALGVVWRIDPLELVGEWSWSLLVEPGAPSGTMWPMDVAVGARWCPGSSPLQLSAMLTMALVSRPPVGPTDPLVPIEPRIGVTLGLSVELDREQPAAKVAYVAPPLPEPSRPSTVRGRVLSLGGNPVEGAAVLLWTGTATVTSVTDASGAFSVPSVQPGAVKLVVRAEGFLEVRRSFDLVRGSDVITDISLSEGLRPGELRGVVHSFRGKGIRATILIEPLGIEIQTREDGSFTVEVPPGSYEVVAKARGHGEQRRQITVDQEGVTVLNLDLRKR